MTIALEKEVKAGETSEKPNKTCLKVGIPKEVYPGECRVAATPNTAKVLQKMGFEVLIESGAGAAANFSDELYQEAECQIISDPQTLWDSADIVLKVRAPQMHPTLGKDETELLSEGGTLISFIWPAQNPELLEKLAARQATVLGMDAVPRISRAQKLDALSSMANIAGYRAVIEAANNFGRFFTGQITAAGKVPPAKVLVIGAGVAGLAAIGAARGLGAIVRAFDTRPVVKEQVESLGAEFLELHFAEDGTGEGGYAKVMSKEFIEAEMALFAEQAKEVDIIITTALIPGKPAPLLITQEMVESMKEGSVIVDMAAEQGGNCAVTKPNEVYKYKGITIIGITDLPSRMANQSSQLYGTNLCHLLKDMGGGENYTVNLEDEVVRGALILHEGKITWPPPKPSTPSPAPKSTSQAATVKTEAVKVEKKKSNGLFWPIVAALALIGIGIGAPSSFLSHFTVFVLACFVGWQIIWNVTPALHTPLMSVTNAISGIIIIGGMLQISGELNSPTTILGAIAVLVGTINISGGFLVTGRMLKMFRK
ncbi:MAG TPA: Re/Si-specific NAD(P)(+) transhydrogenase subunit alpha [Cyanobacteria bacterium UBA11149]|nr:Re/Si-specific NAD(P)(+) transhydrogenase subunit alpha [Cyanobacteria bacterium UBA11367]HBE56084.1 Re/Si-specific NAD(P)(+) transhydrogenase subunit alpha [Cyanobacteria bacterium UBA11366]HBK64086.1 Re/Si-specific NAD(P)(+) transhydrogenase subunit alpha [Cyanobacteria bacterium UBA11166]HBR74986.1 Re/Si-specific NAD(P)(+) transhydrogenase subunit alpha [Cyanobacteria bacterium UBA11159]HBS71492.1 Re/Si-specific NAD(P)(+) transhydrogenase subunit alpha [Cyanobacteria bacterium UBA11153]H